MGRCGREDACPGIDASAAAVAQFLCGGPFVQIPDSGV
jgi:hypothetical protein